MKIHKQSKSSVVSTTASVQDIKKVIKDKLKEAIWEIAQSDDFGFMESDIPSYFFVDTDWYSENTVRAEVRAELSYEGLMELIDNLDPLIQKFDSNAYFEPVTSGIAEAYIDVSNQTSLNSCEAIQNIEAVIDLPVRHTVRFMGENYIVHSNDTTLNVPVGDDGLSMVWEDWRANIRQSSGPYNAADEDYASGWYKGNGRVDIRKHGKLIESADFDVVFDDYESSGELSDAIILQICEMLYEYNKDIPDRMVYNSTSIEASEYLDTAGILGEPNVRYSSEDLRSIYEEGKDHDPSISQYDSFESWFKDTEQYLIYEEDDFSPEEFEQEYTSKDTSINSGKLPAIFRMIDLAPGTINLDYGGGKFDNVAEYLEPKGVTNLVYDPYNRSSEHNQDVIEQIRRNGGADSVTLSNVLNVVKEPEARNNILRNIRRMVKPGGHVYITVYEGSGNGAEGPTKAGYQLNRKTADYMSEIQEVFPDAVRKGKLIIAASTDIDAGDGRYERMRTKYVSDYDGFMTDYSMWFDNETGEYLFILGDAEVYNPENAEPDWETDDLESAIEWFEDYTTDDE